MKPKISIGLKESKIKLIKKIFTSNIIAFYEFYKSLNFDDNWFFLIILKSKLPGKYIYQPYFPIKQKINKFVLLSINKKDGRKPKKMKNNPRKAKFTIIKIVKLLNLKKNIKKVIIIIIKEKNIPNIWHILRLFLDPTSRLQLKLICTDVSNLTIFFQNQLKNLKSRHQKFQILILLKKETVTLGHKINFIFQSYIRNFIGAPQIGKSIFLCSSTRFNSLFLEKLSELGFSNESIVMF